jgi:hypothetical protein
MTLTLTEYFSPLGPVNILYSLFFLLFFDAIGFVLSSSIIPLKKWQIPVRWIMGLGIYVFFWFIVGFFLVPNRNNIFMSAILMGIPAILYHIEFRGYKQIIENKINFLFALVITLPLLFAVYVKSSLPPYQWDEMVYHYLSPRALADITTWKFGGGFYENLPRTIDTFYTLVFSLTHTYSVARLFHFLMLFTILVSVFGWVRERFGKVSALLFVTFCLYTNQNLIQDATSGYVDIAVSSLVFLGIISLWEQGQALWSAWGMAVGTKYSAVIPLISNGLMYTFSFRPKVKQWIVIILMIALFGGYWYIKNLILTGNPTFPLYFPCLRYQESCIAKSSYFEGWIYKINIKNVPVIGGMIFSGNKKLAALFVLAGVLILLRKSKREGEIAIKILTIVLIDFLLMSFSSGYHPRYFIYIQFIFILFVVIPQSRLYKVLLATVALITVVNTINVVYYHSLPKWQIDYALKKSTIYDFVGNILPEMKNVVYWCDNQKDIKEITQLDPELNWFDYEGRMSVFLTNCRYKGFSGEITKDILLVSKSKCQKEVARVYSHEDDQAFSMRKQNNDIICRLKEIVPGLYGHAK